MVTFSKRIGLDTNFKVGCAYGVTSLAVGAGGVALSLTAASTAAIATGVVIALLGANGFWAIVLCAKESQDVDDFDSKIGTYLITTAGATLSEIVKFVAYQVLAKIVQDIIDNLSGRKPKESK